MTLPLCGRRVLVTRAAHQAGKLSDALRALGAEPVEVPVIEIRPPEDFAFLDAALCQLTSSPHPAKNDVCPIHSSSSAEWVGDHDPQPSEATYDWLILTSANAVRALTERAAKLGFALGSFTGKVAAVGAATANAVREAGLIVSLMPEVYVAEALVAELADQAAGKHILIARAAVARDVIPDALRAAGATVDVVDAYRNVIPASAPGQLSQALKQRIDAATFTSSSSVTHLAEVAKLAGIAFPFTGVPAISVGPITTQTLIEHGWPPAVEANPSDIQGLAAAVASIFK